MNALLAVVAISLVGGLAWMVATWLITTLGWTLVLGGLLWGLVALCVLRKAGRLRAFFRLTPYFDRINAASPKAAQTSGPDPATPAAPTPAPDLTRESANDRGVARIDQLFGLEGAKQQLHDLLTLGTTARLRGQTGFGATAPASMLVFQGPGGTGKSQMADAYVHMLYGAGIIAAPHYVTLDSAQLVDQSAGSANTLMRSAAEAALDGVLIIENAQQLLGSSGHDATLVATEVGRGLMHVISRYPHRLIIIAIGETGLRFRLTGQAQFKRELMNKIHVVDVDFDELSTANLVRIFETHAEARLVQVTPEMQQRLPGLMQKLKLQDGPDFDNAHAVARLFDQVCSQARRRNADADFVELTPSDFRLEPA